MIVTSSRDNIKEIVEFSRGQFISHKEEKTSERGVSVLFYPDDKVLETVTFDNNKIESMLQESAFLSKGLAFYYINEIEDIEKTFYSENGLYDYINYLNNGKKFLFEPIHFLAEEGTFQVEVAVGYNEGYNNIYLMCEGGNTYKINVVRGKEKRKVGLKELSIKNHNIDFNVDKYEYFLTLNTNSLDINFITYNDKDKVVVEGNNNLKKGNNIIFIKVLGKEEVIYKINVEKTKGVFGEVKSTKEEKTGVFKEVISIILLIKQ